jgi:hypothetical protein
VHGQKKGRQWKNCLPERRKSALDVRLGFAKTLNAIARFPLSAFLQEIHALETLQDVAFDH